MHKGVLFSLLSLILILALPQSSIAGNGEKVSHDIWDQLLKTHVSEKGNVNYQGFVQDSAKLNQYLIQLALHHPEKDWASNEQKAYWINAYNAFTVQLIVRNYPTKSIKDLGGKIYKINTPWDLRFIHLGEETYDLNNIEHGILRKQWDDPRIHFAVNCASVSCPPLRNEAFVANRLEQQLDDAARKFLADPTKNIITPDRLQLSKIFSWFKGDFTKEGKLIAFLNRYTETQIQQDAKIQYLPYEWGLNE